MRSAADTLEALRAEYDANHAHAADATPQELADILIDLFMKLRPQAGALTALLDSRTDWTEVRRRLRTQTLGRDQDADVVSIARPISMTRRPRMSPPWCSTT